MNPQEIKQILEKASGICLRKPMTSSEYELLLIKMTWERAIKKAEQLIDEIMPDNWLYPTMTNFPHNPTSRDAADLILNIRKELKQKLKELEK